MLQLNDTVSILLRNELGGGRLFRKSVRESTMSAILAVAGLLVTATPVPPVQSVDAAYEEVSMKRDADAIERIEDETPLARAHPAQLINLGIAYARRGDTERARAMFRQAANDEGLYSLETANGDWTSSRILAQRALVSLERGTLGRVRTASR